MNEMGKRKINKPIRAKRRERETKIIKTHRAGKREKKGVEFEEKKNGGAGN